MYTLNPPLSTVPVFGEHFWYLGKSLADELRVQGMEIFTKVRKNMKKRIINKAQKFLLSKRGIIETVIDQLKNCCHIEHKA
ncbi:transposase [endosymbiont of Acanthamoeba sp. UWC8]|uniref:transposase n=1 Tax=endosymbiont of Acanthamoeba sp. UWC8 TaxID=86106 RepID=UPI0039887FB6